MSYFCVQGKLMLYELFFAVFHREELQRLHEEKKRREEMKHLSARKKSAKMTVTDMDNKIKAAQAEAKKKAEEQKKVSGSL